MKELPKLIGLEQRTDGTWWVTQLDNGQIERVSGAEPAFQALQTLWLDRQRQRHYHAARCMVSTLRWQICRIYFQTLERLTGFVSRMLDQAENRNRKKG